MNRLRMLMVVFSLVFCKAYGQSDSVRVNVSVDTSGNKRFFINIEISSTKKVSINICDSIRYGEFICNSSCLIMAFQVLQKDCFQNRIEECAFPVYETPKIFKKFTNHDTIRLRFDITQYFDHIINARKGIVHYGPNVYRFSLIINYLTFDNKNYSAYSDWIYVRFK